MVVNGVGGMGDRESRLYGAVPMEGRVPGLSR
jgi:hypothetical protein